MAGRVIQTPDDKPAEQPTFAPSSKQQAHNARVRLRNCILLLIVAAALVILGATTVYRMVTHRDAPQLNLYTSYQTSEFAQSVARAEFKTHDISQIGGVNLKVYTSPDSEQSNSFIDTVKGYFSFTTVLKGHFGQTASWKDIFSHAELGKPIVVTVNIPHDVRSVLGVETKEGDHDMPLALFVERVAHENLSKELDKLLSHQDLLDGTRLKDHLQSGQYPAGTELYKGVDATGNYWMACVKENKDAYDIFLSVSPDVAVINWTQESLLK